MIKYGLVRYGKVLALRNKLQDLYEMQLTFKKEVNILEFIYMENAEGNLEPVNAIRID